MATHSRIHAIVLTGLALILGLALGLGSAAPVQAQSAPDGTVTATYLNVRTGPSFSGRVISVLRRGATLTLSGRDSTSRWVYGTANNGVTGWVWRAYVQLRSDLSVSSLQVRNSSAPTSGTASKPPASGSSGGSNPPPAAVSGTTSGGFEVGGQVQDLNGNTVAFMRRAKMKWVKRQAFAGDGGAVGLIQQAKANGFKILLSVVGDKNAVVEDGYQNAYASYVGQLAANGADAIEVWNEMNIDREWKTGSISPAIYVSLLAKSYNAIKGANGSTLVITGAPAPTGAEGAFGTARVWNDDRYVAGMAAAGAARYADCIGVHYNEGIVGPDQASGDPRGFYPTRYFSTMLNRALGPFPGKKACFTELGFLTPEGYPPLPGGFAWAGGTSLAEQAAWLARAAVLSSSSGRVRLMIIFNVDFTLYGEDPQAGYAIMRPGGACPACDTLAQVIR